MYLYAPNGIKVAVFCATSVLAGERTIVGDWEPLVRTPADPSAFNPDITQLFGRVTAYLTTVGAGAELRIVEDGPDGLVVIGSTVLADGGGIAGFRKFGTNVLLRVGDHEYRLEARLGGASSFVISSAVMSLLSAL